MTTSSAKDAVVRRLWLTGLVFATASALIAAMWLSSSGNSANASVRETAATDITELISANTTGADGDRAELRKDLQAARKLKGQARLDAIKKIRADAAAGKYGEKVEKRTDRRSDRRAAAFALLPDDLQADLKELKAMPGGEERKARRAEIRKDALAGEYGEKVQEAAKLLQKD
ncbi:MAG: hypothetical protein ABIN55_09735 [Aeromicrobium sp.]